MSHAASTARSDDFLKVRKNLHSFSEDVTLRNGFVIKGLSQADTEADGSTHLGWYSLAATRLLIPIEQRPGFDADPLT